MMSEYEQLMAGMQIVIPAFILIIFAVWAQFRSVDDREVERLMKPGLLHLKEITKDFEGEDLAAINKEHKEERDIMSEKEHKEISEAGKKLVKSGLQYMEEVAWSVYNESMEPKPNTRELKDHEIREQFSMSTYANKEDLYKAKSEYFEAKYKKVSNKYSEIIMAVARKFPDETRHETALKYIKRMEEPSTCAAQQETQKED